MTFRRCDIVYGADLFKGDEYVRLWLVVSNDSHPFHGEQYVVLALTTKTWNDNTIPIDGAAWAEGGTPQSSSIVPWSVETIEHSDIEHWQGTLAEPTVDEAVTALIGYVRSGE